MQTSAKIICDSIYEGYRLTTMEVTFHRFVLAEFNTHRVFSRNSASSRAIPVEKQLEKIVEFPAFPLEWPCEQPGMQGGAIMSGVPLEDAGQLFYDVWDATTELIAEYIEDHPEKSQRLHKSLINRLLEPFMWHTVIVTATEWDGFFRQRCSPLAQPEIRVAAELMKDAYDLSVPRRLQPGEWHLPYITEEDKQECVERELDVRKVSVGRCARVSYLTHDGVRDLLKDVQLFEDLIVADPPHASPLEHVATPCTLWGYEEHTHEGNFMGWDQMRHSVLGF